MSKSKKSSKRTKKAEIGQQRIIKRANTTTLWRLNEASIKKDYNRNLSDEFFVHADPDGTHILSVLLVHEHAQMRPVPPHYRCMVWAKMKGKTTPTNVILDIPINLFNSLTDARV